MNPPNNPYAPPSQEKAGCQRPLVRLFEAADATNEEAYYTLGIWPTLAEAVAEISGCSDPVQLGSDGEHEEYCYVEIRERWMGWSGIGKVVWKIKWRGKYTDESDEYTWEMDADPLPNDQVLAVGRDGSSPAGETL